MKQYALNEFRLAGWIDENGKYNDEMQELICKHILHLLEVFEGEGHSGFSAKYALDIFNRIANWKPISPLTGEDDEWNDIGEYGNGEPHFQNKRYSSVFKDKDGKAYDIDGRVFWCWVGSKEEPSKCHFTGNGSAVPVTFPYTPPDEPIYEYKCSEEDYNNLPQNEQGVL
jgi:hypothetical protein